MDARQGLERVDRVRYDKEEQYEIIKLDFVLASICVMWVCACVCVCMVKTACPLVSRAFARLETVRYRCAGCDVFATGSRRQADGPGRLAGKRKDRYDAEQNDALEQNDPKLRFYCHFVLAYRL